ncbi:hypothetical protein PhCBS80983_g05091 [Powellomyces hirtus]|uniref:Uncharacterized protein n=1 Tax=Powellomyces hirtus TaxID=109895 RepID=A0A507DW52_9FUNG|nr:hypothetical protein PhCBS80983_g05091 [Powellomyces hirtus]
MSTSREAVLVDHLKANPPKGFPSLVAENWEVVPGRSQNGVGDLVFASPYDQFLVVEVKALHPGSGSTARASRTKARSDVARQVRYYGRCWAERYPHNEVYCQCFVGQTPEDATFGERLRV